ncbi:asparagine synthase (glutamine-hydrolyzing) [Thermocrinis jamiesonii]|uniref:asparagine synthase (glutamine-hydrolyzing) n=1 Tax=Thermocrinis jamiesonii TaxID=1302351 RepID=UPI000495E24A|nr:asparagine synthase (glutamine-hydrolyzing) [Thermocrinis jamiesonii]
MCRIVGFLDLNYKQDYPMDKTILNMRDTLTHGGPDDAGVYLDKDIPLAFGHRRLSILDLSPLGRQPMEFENLVITYNGEVYNFKEIRQELEKEGYKFFSNSDTEVILKAFHRWGMQAVQKFRGMFAFALWDKEKKELILCRDRVGVKPLFYYYKNGLFMFASELKAFHKHPKFEKEIDPIGLSLYLQYGYIPAPYTIFKNTFKLKPAHFLIVKPNGEIEEIPYWSIETFFKEGRSKKDIWLKKREDELAQELEDILTESFKLRLVSDVPVGMFLSGGIDSSTVCALLAKEGIRLKTFTIGFYEKEYNEAEYAKKIAEYLGTEHTELYCTPKEAFEIIPKLPEIYDEPFGDSSAIPTCLVSKLARSQVKVSLSADGGDEQFCGYSNYWLISDKIKKLSKIPFSGLISKLLDVIHPDFAQKIYNTLKPILPKYTNFRDKFIKLRNVLKVGDSMEMYNLAVSYFLEEDLKELGLNSYRRLTDWSKEPKLDLLSSMMLTDLKTYLPDDILVKVDRATMAVALEGREPFLDHMILEWTCQLPSEFKYKNGVSKYILRKVLYKYVPRELLDRPKQGFGVPIYEWFKRDLKELYIEYLSEHRIRSAGIFDFLAVKRLLDDYFMDRGVNHNKLWLLFVFELWREKWI